MYLETLSIGEVNMFVRKNLVQPMSAETVSTKSLVRVIFRLMLAADYHGAIISIKLYMVSSFYQVYRVAI